MTRSLWAVLGLALAVRLVLFVWFFDLPIRIHDEKDYNAIATNLVLDGDFALNRGTPCSARPPLYPAFLALIYRLCGLENFAAVRLVQVVLGVITTWVIYLLARELLPRQAAMVAASLYALYPSLAIFDCLLLTETLFTLLFCGMCYALIRAHRQATLGWLAAAGILCGLGALTRSALWVFPPVAGLCLLGTLRGSAGRRFAAATVFGLAAYAVILPWAVRSSRLEKAFIPVDTMSGRNMMMGNYQYTPLFRSWDAVALTGKEFWFNEVIEHYPEAQSATQGQIDKFAMKRGIHFIKENPGLTLERDGIKFFQFWGLERELIAGAQRGFFGNIPSAGVILLAGVIVLGYVFVFLTALLGMVVAPPDDRRRHGWLLLAAAFLCGLHTVVFAHSRYHLPVMPLLMVYSASLLCKRPVFSGVPRWRWAVGGLLCLLFMVAWALEVTMVESARIKDVIRAPQGDS